jgi:hypothetical protein
MNPSLNQWLAACAANSGMLGCGIRRPDRTCFSHTAEEIFPHQRMDESLNFLVFPFPIFDPAPSLCRGIVRRRNPQAVQLALAEDIGGGDATTLATVPQTQTAKAIMRAREPLVVAGIQFAEMAFCKLSPKIKVEQLASDGQKLPPGKRC